MDGSEIVITYPITFSNTNYTFISSAKYKTGVTSYAGQWVELDGYRDNTSTKIHNFTNGTNKGQWFAIGS